MNLNKEKKACQHTNFSYPLTPASIVVNPAACMPA